ncbi:hypothetical protein UY3_14846 [Chelonia mydas]|uniref:Uncharacterized protein n=1 Tax=Chelonia mydas TaxID=8469 RepID=M7BIK4_CHEMY|nr:hypothetical protein UY3_14846 [Chelonia mydas]
MEFLFSHPPPNSITVHIVNSKGCQHHFKSTPYDRDWKHLKLFGRKTYSSASLQFRIANYQALMAKYDYQSYSKLNSFIERFPDLLKEQFKAMVNKGLLMANTSLQSALDAADRAAHSISAAIMMR